MEKNIFLKSTTPHLQRLFAIKIKSRAQPLVPSLLGHTVKGMRLEKKKKMIPPTCPQLPPLPCPIPDLYISPAGMCLRGYGTLKYGDVHEKFNFLEIQDLRPLRTCQKHFETILPNFLPDECEI